MEFSESLNFGNSTYINLENLAKHAIDENGIKRSGGDQAANTLDSIDESPTNKKTFINGSRSRLLGNTTSRTTSNCKENKHVNYKTRNESKTSKFRKTKSDSNLDTVSLDCHSVKRQLENYSDFFHSGFSIEEQTEQIEELLVAAKPDNSSLMRVSKLEAALQEGTPIVGGDFSNNSNVLSKLDAAIFSDDIQALLGDTDDKQLQEQEITEQLDKDLWHDSLIFSVLSTVNEDKEKRNKSKFLTDFDKPQVDEASFIECGNKEEIQHAIHEELERSKHEVRRAMLEEPHLRPNNVTLKGFTKEDSKLYCLPRKQAHELPQKTKAKREILHGKREALKNIANWQLPDSILREYEKKGIRKMFDWQIECLSNPKVLFEHCNLVYSAPTSAGKTLVSEILLIKTILEREKKVLLILPFISVVREKMFYLQDLLLPSGYRVEGFFGGYTPPGGFESINVAICTIEKANAIVNKLLEQGKLADIGIVVVDEVHLISDPGRGYILELLLAKILYMSRKNALHIQVVAMSATLANVSLLQRWLQAELYITTYRPVALQEMIKIGNKIFDCNMKQLRELSLNDNYGVLQNDGEQVAQLCIETLLEGCSVLVFCPSKDWCEKLAIQLAGAIHVLGKSGTEFGLRLRANLKRDDIDELKRQLKDIPTGLDAVLERTITFACAFHHAGMTLEERDLIEAGFKSGALKVIVATSTLSSGVNLPARRVLIRTPLFGGKQMSSLTYRQMIGRAGRTGKDTLGESILLCTESNARIGRKLITAGLKAITSCLEMESSTHLKRALLEVISSGVALTRKDILSFVNCTLLSTEKRESTSEDDAITNGDNSIESMPTFIKESLDFLIEYEFTRLQFNEESNTENYIATRLGQACLASSMPPTDGLILFAELQKSRRCFVLESELHAVYLVTPYSVCSQLHDLDWLLYLDMWEKLKPAMKKVGELVGIKESFLVRAMRGQTKLDYKLMQIHKRFYTALALQELVNETPINQVALKYKCTRGMLQSLQQMASTFAGIVTAFCNSLNWSTLALIVSQFKERLFFGIHRDLIDLMRLPDLNHKRARALYDAGITNLIELANADSFTVEKVLYNALSFDTIKKHDDENAYETERRNVERNFFITGKLELTVCEASKVLVQNARLFVQYEIGVGNIHWSQSQSEATKETSNHQMEDKEHRLSSEEVELDDTSRKQLKRKNNDKAQKPMTAKVVKGVKDEETTNKVLNSCEIKHTGIVSQGEYNRKRDGDVVHISDIENNAANLPASKTYHLEESKQSSNIINAHINKPLKSKATFPNKETEVQLKPITHPQVNRNKPKREEVPIFQNPEPPVAKLHKFTSEMQIPKSYPDTRNKEVPIAQPSESKVSTAKLNTKATSTKQPFEQLTTKPANQIKLLQEEGGKVAPQNEPFNFNTPPAKILPAVGKMNTLKESKSSIINNYKMTNPLNATTTKKTPRRSPRNHLASSTRIVVELKKSETFSKNGELELFMNEDESFEMNTGIANVLEAADKLLNADTPSNTPSNLNKSNDDEIPSSQKIEEDVDRVQTPQRSRFLRSYRVQRIESPKVQKQQQQPAPPVALPPTPPPTTSSSIELSDISMGNSLMQNPQQLNTSEMLNCSAEDSEASHFKCVEIIDICGNQTLFKSAFKELNTAQRLGVSFGLKKDANKRKPLIGANLLTNPVSNDDDPIKDVQFSLDDSSSTYLAGVAFAIRENVVYFMNMQDTDTCKGLTKELKCKYLRLLFKSPELTLLMHDAKEQLKVLRKAIPTLTDICVHLQDPKVANWLLQPDRNLNFAKMVEQFAPECMKLVKLCGSERGYSSIGLNAESAICAKVRCAVEACITTYILKGQIENLESLGSGQLIKFFNELEMPLQLSLCNMETYGFPTSESALRQLFHKMMETMKKLEVKIYELHGARFNLGSTSAVARVLGLHRKTNGRISTSRQILEKIDSPISQLIIAYRKLNVTLTKNIQPLLKCVVNNRIHGQSVTFGSTGRISMTDPNLQNVAKDFLIDLGATDKITISCRSAFFAIDEKRCLISSDFCQLEMRILAHLSQDATLLQVINSETDVFTALAARWNKLSEDQVSEQLRNGTKQICYGIVYGMGMRSLAEALKCTEEEANSVSEQFHAAYPGIRAYTEKVIKFARHKGYIETITGRRRYLEHINSGELQFKKQAERQAINSTIQGSAADIAKSAITRMENNITKYREKLGIELASSVQLVLHLHDELIYEVPEEKAKKVAKILRVTMENCVKLNVPLKVKIKIGKSWGSLKEVNL